MRGQVIKEFTVKKPHIETATALGRVLPVHALSAYPAYIGLDVHKETIAVAVACKGREAPRVSCRDYQQSQGGHQAGGAFKQRVQWRSPVVLL